MDVHIPSQRQVLVVQKYRNQWMSHRSSTLRISTTISIVENTQFSFPLLVFLYMHSYPAWFWGEQSNMCFEVPMKRDLMALVRAKEETLDFNTLQLRWQLRLTAGLRRTRTTVSSVFLATAAGHCSQTWYGFCCGVGSQWFWCSCSRHWFPLFCHQSRQLHYVSLQRVISTSSLADDFVQLIDKIVDVPMVMQRHVPRSWTSVVMLTGACDLGVRTVTASQVQYIVKLFVIPATIQRQAPTIKTVQGAVDVCQFQCLDRVVRRRVWKILERWAECIVDSVQQY